MRVALFHRRPLTALQVEVTSRCTRDCAICARSAFASDWRDGDLADATWDRLREIADSLVAQEPEGTDILVGPYDAEERFRRENGFRPEVSLEARIVPEKDYFEPVDDGARDRLRPLEQRLRDLGLRPGHW